MSYRVSWTILETPSAVRQGETPSCAQALNVIFKGDDHSVEKDKFCQSVKKGILLCEHQKLGNNLS